MTDRLVRTGLLLPAAAVWAAALLATALPGVAPVAAAATACVGAVLVIRAVRHRTRAAVLLAAGALACCALLCAVVAGEARRHPADLVLDRPAQLDVRVDALSATAGNDATGALTLRSMLRGTVVRHAGQASDIPVLLFADSSPGVAPGGVVRLRAVLHRAAPTDSAAAVGSVVSRITMVERPPPAQALAAMLRQGLLDRTERLPGDGERCSRVWPSATPRGSAQACSRPCRTPPSPISRRCLARTAPS